MESLIAKVLATVTRTVLALATLGNATQIEIILCVALPKVPKASTVLVVVDNGLAKNITNVHEPLFHIQTYVKCANVSIRLHTA